MNDHKKIWLSPPDMGGEEIALVKDAFDSNWISSVGPHLEAFEKELTDYTKAGHAAVLSSGTAAIHLSLILLGVGPGDEVIVPSFTFAASANPVAYQHAKPVFVGSEEETWNISPEFLEQAIKDGVSRNQKPKAVVLVHLYGMPCKLDETLAICSKYEIPVIEDAAEALGSQYKKQKLGTFGKFGILSFNGNKIITTSGGGALLSSDQKLVEKAKFLATQARDDAPHYQHSEIGYNYRLSNVLAGIGRGQLQLIDQYVQKRRDTFEYYKEHLGRLPGFSFPEEPSGDFFSNRWLTTALIDPKKTGGASRETFRLSLAEKNIEARPMWKPLHLQPIFKDCTYFGNKLEERLFEEGLCLPSGSALGDEELNRICSVVRGSL